MLVPRNSSSTMVYAGSGSSHSWTWLADLFESRGIFNVVFASESDFRHGIVSSHSRVIISGGDGFEIAEALNGKGFSNLKGFIRDGGQYIGICAGAYLPLPSSISPFQQFNISKTRIANIRHGISMAESSTTRYAVRYGSCSIFHPARGSVLLDIHGSSIVAPLYGGPVFKEPDEDEVLVRYTGMAEQATTNMSHDEMRTVLDCAPAVIRCRFGSGELLLLGPHLEHPDFQEANDVLLGFLHLAGNDRSVRIQEQLKTNLDRSIADLKVAILGLEHRSFVVGSKLWDGGRLMELLNAIEIRKSSTEGAVSDRVDDLMRAARDEILEASSRDAHEVESAPSNLVEAARLTVNEHFSARR
ncbi:MAG: BPL-N domain-containing protein [Thermoplasmata archaeon]|nr:BPL-N domain-containing protein [Thermoplasmata archaeon]